jgi:hypothetical protein
MKRTYFVCLFLCLTTSFSLSQSNPVPVINQTPRVVSPSVSQFDSKAQAKILESYGKLPLSFEANHGQTDTQVKFLSRTSVYSLFLTGDEAVLTLRGKKTDTSKAKIRSAAHTLPSGMAEFKTCAVLRMKLVKANPAAKVTGVDELAGTSNYFIGNDPAKWRTNVPTYAKVKYEGIYSGIDLVYYGNQRQLEYDFIVGPGADPHRIAFDVRGAKRIRRDEHGDLVLKLDEGEIRWHKPVVYQVKNGARQEIAARYAITDTNRVGFDIAGYDASRQLYIDPLIYSTYLGGSSGDGSYAIGVDSAGNAYVTGVTSSPDFPVTSGAFQTTIDAGGSAFVTKFNPTGSALVYSTYLGGSGADYGQGIAVDTSGYAYLTGYTSSPDFPVTPGAFQTTCGNPNPGYCNNVFVTKLNPTGSALVYSSYLGGSGTDTGYGVALDSADDAYVTGRTTSTDFPTTLGAFQTTLKGSNNAFVSKINPTGSALVYSTYLGGSGGQDYGYAIAVDSAGNAYVTGVTDSTDFPVTPGAFQTVCKPIKNCFDAFVSKFEPTGSALVYSTYLGGSGQDYGQGIAVDSAGNAYVTGVTDSTNFPVTHGAFQTKYRAHNYEYNAFVSNIQMLAVTTTTLSSSLNPSAYGQTVVFTATVTSSAGAPPDGETVTFKQGTTVLRTKSLSGGTAIFSISTLAVGTKQVTAVYRGDSNLAGSTSKDVNQVIKKARTTTTLASSMNPSKVGQSVTFTASVTPEFSGTPTGKVAFYDGTKKLGSVTLSGGAATFKTSKLTSGRHSITATYNGSTSFDGSSPALVTQTVN